MKNKRCFIAALLLIVFLAISILPASAASNGTLIYSTQTNSGERHVVCTTLEGTSADDYYTGSYTYSTLSQLSATQLYSELHELMTDTHKKQSTYNDCKTMAGKTDCENNDGLVNLIYTSYSTTLSKFSGNVGTWNREHVWPKSLGGFETSGPGGDLHHIRPSDATVNSARGNCLYGEVSNGSAVYCNASLNGGSSYISGYKANGYFEPLDNVKGDVARICLYVYVRYGTGEGYSKCSSITNVFSDIDTLLEWCELDPVDTWEMGRNEVVGAYQGNRNVFIDYPEYAWLLFGKSIPDDITTPSDSSSTEIGGGDTGSEVTPPDTGTTPDNGNTDGDNGNTGSEVTPPDTGVTPDDGNTDVDSGNTSNGSSGTGGNTGGTGEDTGSTGDINNGTGGTVNNGTAGDNTVDNTTPGQTTDNKPSPKPGTSSGISYTPASGGGTAVIIIVVVASTAVVAGASVTTVVLVKKKKSK